MKFIIGVVVGLLILPAFAYLYVRMGYAPVATAEPPLPLEKTITGMALNARVAKDAPTQSPLPATEPNLIAGAKSYRRSCSLSRSLSVDKGIMHLFG
jgi:thiosulfate dehydrogenase